MIQIEDYVAPDGAHPEWLASICPHGIAVQSRGVMGMPSPKGDSPVAMNRDLIPKFN